MTILGNICTSHMITNTPNIRRLSYVKARNGYRSLSDIHLRDSFASRDGVRKRSSVVRRKNGISLGLGLGLVSIVRS